jgi:hypothetical protein
MLIVTVKMPRFKALLMGISSSVGRFFFNPSRFLSMIFPRVLLSMDIRTGPDRTMLINKHLSGCPGGQSPDKTRTNPDKPGHFMK